MDDLSLADLKQGLEEFFATREPLLHGTASAALCVEDLRAKLHAFEALPPALTGGPPLSEQLRETDRLHDAAYHAIHDVLQGWLLYPALPPELRPILEQARASFVPDLQETQASYAIEAVLALDRREQLEAMRPQLERFPLPGGQSLADWIGRMLEYGLALERDLRRRNEELSEAVRAAAAALRFQTIAKLRFLETALEHEVQANPALPRDLSQQALAGFRQLAARRGQADRAPRPPVEPG